MKTANPASQIDVRLYTDAGLAAESPSRYGASYAHIVTVDGKRFAVGDGDFYPADVDVIKIDSNHAELYSICMGVFALADMPEMFGASYTLCVDNLNALNWFGNYPLPGGYSGMLYDLCGKARAAELRAHLKRSPRLIKGHPSREDLARGYMIDKGKQKPVDLFNHQCDIICTRRRIAIAKRLCPPPPVEFAELLPPCAPATVSPLALASATAVQIDLFGALVGPEAQA